MSIPIAEVIRTLAKFPNGATVNQLAAHMGIDRESLGSRLSKTYLYGGPIDRTPQRVHTSHGSYKQFVWSAR